MQVAVLGSWRPSRTAQHESYWDLKGPEDFRLAAFDLGQLLARTSRSVLVSNDLPDSLDTHVVQGVLSILQGRHVPAPLIHVIPNSSRPKQPFEDLARLHNVIIVTEPVVARDVAEARLIAVRMATAVVLAAGTESTYEAGLIAMINRKRLIPIGSFGGAGKRLLERIGQWRAFGLHVPNSVPPASDIAQLAGPWTSAKLEVVERLLDIRTYLKLLIIYGRSDDWQPLKSHLHVRLKLPEPVVMGEIFGAGRALPEKFEQLALPVHAAIAVITPADRVGPWWAKALGVWRRGTAPLPRARQNVWLEIGWFWGALGRSRILLLTKGDVDIPSDLDGIEHVKYRLDPGRECATQIEDFISSLNSVG